MTRLDTIGTHKTTVSHDTFIKVECVDGIERTMNSLVTAVRYHDTNVVAFNDDFIILNTGGYRTPTTKRRMNQASLQYNLGFSVYQADFTWYVRCGDDIQPYYNGIVIDIVNKSISRKLKDIN